MRQRSRTTAAVVRASPYRVGHAHRSRQRRWGRREPQALVRLQPATPAPSRRLDKPLRPPRPGAPVDGDVVSRAPSSTATPAATTPRSGAKAPGGSLLGPRVAAATAPSPSAAGGASIADPLAPATRSPSAPRARVVRVEFSPPSSAPRPRRRDRPGTQPCASSASWRPSEGPVRPQASSLRKRRPPGLVRLHAAACRSGAARRVGHGVRRRPASAGRWMGSASGSSTPSAGADQLGRRHRPRPEPVDHKMDDAAARRLPCRHCRSGHA